MQREWKMEKVHEKKKRISRRSVREQPFFFISTRPDSLNAARQRDPCSRRQASTPPWT